MNIEKYSFIFELQKEERFKNMDGGDRIVRPDVIGPASGLAETESESLVQEVLVSPEVKSQVEAAGAPNINSIDSFPTDYGLSGQQHFKSAVDNPNQGLTMKNSYHLVWMVLPNLLNPKKFFRNMLHPFEEWIHNGHKQYPITDDGTIHMVEHTLRGKLLTVDIVERDKMSNGVLPKLSRLFSSDFYYGHCQYFPGTFKLINRTYVNGKEFDINAHAKNVLTENGFKQ